MKLPLHEFSFVKATAPRTHITRERNNFMRKILINKIRCKKCGDIIESKSVHDFKFCKCEAVAVDGDHDYLRRVGALEDWEELSVCETIEDHNTTEET